MRNYKLLSNLAMVIITVFAITTYHVFDSENLFHALTAFGTLGFFALLMIQLLKESDEHDIEFRPALVLNRRNKNHIVSQKEESGMHVISVELTNVGRISTGAMRIFALPLDKTNKFHDDKSALVRYIKKTGSRTLKSDRSCMVIGPIRKTLKRDPDRQYLIVGRDLVELNKRKDEFNSILEKFERKDEFVEAVKTMTKNLLELDLRERENFGDYKRNTPNRFPRDHLNPIIQSTSIMNVSLSLLL